MKHFLIMLLKPNPWCDSEKNQDNSGFEKTAEFEDNFEPIISEERSSSLLPDSKQYLDSLGKVFIFIYFDRTRSIIFFFSPTIKH